MSNLTDHYKLFKEADSAKQAVRHGMFIATYRNMELHIGKGDLNRGTNFYVNWQQGTKFGLIGWKNIPLKEVMEEFTNFKFGL